MDVFDNNNLNRRKINKKLIFKTKFYTFYKTVRTCLPVESLPFT